MTDSQLDAFRCTQKTSTDEARAYLSFVGDFKPTGLSIGIAISPTRTYVKGELRPRTGRPYEVIRWSLESRLPETEAGDEHVDDVLEQVRLAKERIKKLA